MNKFDVSVRAQISNVFFTHVTAYDRLSGIVFAFVSPKCADEFGWLIYGRRLRAMFEGALCAVPG
jgi:hypothetical protein